jgi:transcription-repair coupling factor (superfamily II helicase)
VQNLIAAAELRLMCERLGIAQLDRKRAQIELPNPNGNKKQPLRQFVEMLHIRFAAEAADSSQQQSAANGHIDPATIMRLVARNARRGAQFTPQGVLRWPLSSAKAADVLSEARTLLESLSATG